MNKFCDTLKSPITPNNFLQEWYPISTGTGSQQVTVFGVPNNEKKEDVLKEHCVTIFKQLVLECRPPNNKQNFKGSQTRANEWQVLFHSPVYQFHHLRVEPWYKCRSADRQEIQNGIEFLLKTPLFTPLRPEHQLGELEQVYRRAQAIGKACDKEYTAFSLEDVISLTDKFWEFHMANFLPREKTSFILIAIQLNLALGTIAPAVAKKEEFQSILNKILDFEVSAQFLLTEADHGLDAKNMETVATLQADGSFILNTPHPGAAKLVPPLAGGFPLDHALTSFQNVYLPPSALLGTLEAPKNEHENFLRVIGRVAVGTLSLSLSVIPALKACAYIYGLYSLRRTVLGHDGKSVPIIAFRTQQIPLLRTLAQVAVMEKMAWWVIKRFRNPKIDPRIRHGLATITKVLFLQHCQQNMSHLIERCGSQGLFLHNQMVDLQNSISWISVAEGDTGVLSIHSHVKTGLATELILGRYRMPAPRDPTTLLAKHEAGLIAAAREQIKKFKGGHRSEVYNNYILPRCKAILEAIGHRMAYEAAQEAGLPADILSLYVTSALETDMSWYIEKQEITRAHHGELENAALDSMLPRIETLLEETGAGPYCTAPIASLDDWAGFCETLPCYTGNAVYVLETEPASEVQNSKDARVVSFLWESKL
ncbi:hypothetical protein FQN57_000969 [Myotisia sp. PD_48]|nr:hypothetical protein FQN57_000969 [Myotisia sp. PD_48]